MGWKGRIKAALEKTAEKAKENDLVERVRENLPKVLGAGVALGSFYLIKDASVDYIGFGKVGELPMWLKAGITGLAGYFVYSISEQVAYRFLFKQKDGSLEDLLEEEHVEDGKELARKDGISSWLLEHPKIMASVPTAYVFYNVVIDTAYRCVYKAYANMNIINANKERFIAKKGIEYYEKLMGDVEKVIDVALTQLIPIGILQSMAIYGCAVILTNITNIFLNPKYRKSSFLRQKAEFVMGKDYDRAVKLVEKAISILPTKETYFQLARVHLKHTKIDLALKAYSDGMKISSKKSPYDRVLDAQSITKNPNIEVYQKYKKGIRNDPLDPSHYISLAVLHWRLPSRHLSYKVMEEAERKFSDNIHIKFIYAMMLDESINKSDNALSQEKWVGGIEILLKNPSNRFRKAHESSNEVLECILDEFIRGAIIFKKGDGKNLEKEMELVNESQRLAEGFSDYKTVQPLRIFDFAGEKVYGMKRDEGEKLYFLKNKDVGLFLKVADFLALVHARFPGAMSEKGRIDIPSVVKDKLAYRDMNLPEYIIKKVIDNYAPVYNSFANATYVFNKDANPENWIVGRDGKITAIDWEDKGLVPMQFDLVNLLEYNGATLKDEQKDAIIREYVNSYNKYKGEKTVSDMDEFMLGYFNAVVQRAIALCSAWSSLDRPIMRKKRGIILDNAINSLGRLEREHKEYYTWHRANYEALKEAMEEIRAICSSA